MLTAPRVLVLSGEWATLSIRTDTVTGLPPVIARDVISDTRIEILPELSKDAQHVLLDLNVRCGQAIVGESDVADFNARLRLPKDGSLMFARRKVKVAGDDGKSVERTLLVIVKATVVQQALARSR